MAVSIIVNGINKSINFGSVGIMSKALRIRVPLCPIVNAVMIINICFHSFNLKAAHNVITNKRWSYALISTICSHPL